MWLSLINIRSNARTTEAKTKSKIYHVLGDANQLVLNCKRFSYFRQFTHNIIIQNTTNNNIMYLYGGPFTKYITWEEAGSRQRKQQIMS